MYFQSRTLMSNSSAMSFVNVESQFSMAQELQPPGFIPWHGRGSQSHPNQATTGIRLPIKLIALKRRLRLTCNKLVIFVRLEVGGTL